MNYLKFFLIISIPVGVWAGTPRHPLPNTPDQVWQNDLDLNDKIDRLEQSLILPHKMLAEILAITPVRTGQTYYCTDCSVAVICVSTGTAVLDFASASGRTDVCN